MPNVQLNTLNTTWCMFNQNNWYRCPNCSLPGVLTHPHLVRYFAREKVMNLFLLRASKPPPTTTLLFISRCQIMSLPVLILSAAVTRPSQKSLQAYLSQSHLLYLEKEATGSYFQLLRSSSAFDKQQELIKCCLKEQMETAHYGTLGYIYTLLHYSCWLLASFLVI